MTSIRSIAVGLPVRDGHVLAQSGTDSHTGQEFYRAIGSGIEFRETAEAALRREFREEVGVRLGTVRFLGVLENIFAYEGRRGHENVHVFGVKSEEIDSIPLDANLHVLDEGSPLGWVALSTLGLPLYPNGIIEILHAWSETSSPKDSPTATCGAGGRTPTQRPSST